MCTAFWRLVICVCNVTVARREVDGSAAACAALPTATSGKELEQRSSDDRRSDEKVQLQAAS